MAILSNVNGKFAVDSTGAIQFSGSAGTSGYILRSNGNAAPTWVDSSTVIGGPYLPLTGGTLSGPLAGTSATFSGILTAQSSSSGDYVRLYGASGTGKWDIYGNGANLRISDNESAGILVVDTGATFGGNVTLNTNGTNFTHGYSGNGLVLSHHNVGPSNAIVSGNSVYPDNLYINNGGAASDWSNVIITGNVRIGTDSPVTKLEVDPSISNSSIKTGTLELQSYSVNNAWLADNVYYSGAWYLRSTGYASQVYFGSGGDISFKRFATGNAGTVATPVLTMQLDSAGNVGIGKSQSGNAALTVRSSAGGNTGIILIEGDTTDDGWGVYATTANKYIITRFTGGSYSDKFTILEGGNVGINTASPTSKLEVRRYSGDRTTLSTIISVTNEGSGPYTGFGGKISFNSNIYYGATTPGIIETAYVGAVLGTSYETTSDLVFATRVSATSVTEKMRILGNGNVGIGTTLPGAKLDVAGIIRSKGNNNYENILTKEGSTGTFTFTYPELNAGIVDNVSYFIFVSVYRPTFDVANDVGTLLLHGIMPRGGNSVFNTINTLKGTGISVLTATNSGNSLVITTDSNVNLRCAIKFISIGGTA